MAHDIPKPAAPVFLRNDGKDAWNNRTAWFRCACGKEFVGAVTRVKHGRTLSCGCYPRAVVSRIKLRHGESRGPVGGTREYAIWHGMMTRCYNPNIRAYPRYGGRGIVVCDRWHTYEGFLADMGRAPTPEHTLDRINNDGSYAPENCKWATWYEQANNRSNNRRIELDGVTRTMTQWCRMAGISLACARERIKLGWDVRRALTQKAEPRKPFRPRQPSFL